VYIKNLIFIVVTLLSVSSAAQELTDNKAVIFHRQVDSGEQRVNALNTFSDRIEYLSSFNQKRRGANCYNAVLFVNGLVSRPLHNTGGTLNTVLNYSNQCLEVRSHQKGDVEVIYSDLTFKFEVPVHGFTYMEDDVIFEKKGRHIKHPYRYTSRKESYLPYDVKSQCIRTDAYRSRNCITWSKLYRCDFDKIKQLLESPRYSYILKKITDIENILFKDSLKQKEAIYGYSDTLLDFAKFKEFEKLHGDILEEFTKRYNDILEVGLLAHNKFSILKRTYDKNDKFLLLYTISRARSFMEQLNYNLNDGISFYGIERYLDTYEKKWKILYFEK